MDQKLLRQYERSGERRNDPALYRRAERSLVGEENVQVPPLPWKSAHGQMVELGQVRRVIIAHRDRLVRFGYDYFEAFCERHHTEIVVITGENLSPEQALGRDLIAIVTVFSARLHGLRTYEKAMKDAALYKDQD